VADFESLQPVTRISQVFFGHIFNPQNAIHNVEVQTTDPEVYEGGFMLVVKVDLSLGLTCCVSVRRPRYTHSLVIQIYNILHKTNAQS
jgi:hypothetical protein